jgi:hypothetical protein
MLIYVVRTQDNAFGNELMANVILGTSTGRIVEQSARNAGQINAPGVFVFDLVHATFATSVA